MKLLLLLLKWILIIIVIGFLLWSITCLFLYRITTPNSETEISAEVHYKFIEINLTNRQLFEELLGNRIVRLEEYAEFYVSKEDRALLWPENPHEMYKKQYTIKARISVSRLKFGGFSVAKVVATEKLKNIPIISK